jgi:tetratricopeptide (TPR) repeat protein
MRSALGLWRGHAAEDVTSEVVQATATRLNERRVSVWQHCLDLELGLGNHANVIGELSELVAAYPLNERFRAQLILALYRAGRQADALEAFRLTRQTLQAELGLDPGDELRRLETSILAHDPQLDLPGGMKAPSGAPFSARQLPTPRQLPRTIGDFTGRQEMLGQICESLAGDPRDSQDVQVVVLSGRGGVGKTALAVRAGHRLQGAFPDGQLFLRLDSDTQQSASGLLEDVLRSAGIRPEVVPRDLEGRSAMYRSWLADRRVLVVIDGATSVGQLTHFLPGTPGCAAIVTSNQRLASLEGALEINVGPLDDRSAYRLLTTIIGAGRVSAEEGEARTLIQLCEGLPLALRIVAAKLAARPHWQITRMIRQLVGEERRLDELDLDGMSVRVTINLAYETLDEDAKRLFRRLSLAGADDFPPWVSAPLLDLDIAESEELLHRMVQSYLVETRIAEDGTVRFHLHALVRIYAAERLASEETTRDRIASARRLLGCWLFITTLAHRQIYGGDFAVLHGVAEHWPLPPHITDALIEDAPDWFRREGAALMSAIRMACSLGLDELCWDLAVTTATLFESGHYSDDWRESHESALALVRSARNERGEAALLSSLGFLELGTRLSWAQEYFGQALKIFEAIDDDGGRALALAGLAFADRMDGNYDRALQTYRIAVADFRTAGDLAGEAYTLKAMGRIHADWQDFGTAEELLNSSLAICKKLGSVRLTAQAQYELGEMHLRQGRLTDAIEALEPVQQWTMETGDVIGQAYALCALGNARRLIGDLNGARVALVTALELTGRGDDRLIRGRILLALAELDHALDRDGLAMSRTREAIRVFDEFSPAGLWHARAYELAGRLHEQVGRFVEAQRSWDRAIELAGEADLELVGQLASGLARLRSSV